MVPFSGGSFRWSPGYFIIIVQLVAFCDPSSRITLAFTASPVLAGNCTRQDSNIPIPSIILLLLNMTVLYRTFAGPYLGVSRYVYQNRTFPLDNKPAQGSNQSFFYRRKIFTYRLVVLEYPPMCVQLLCGYFFRMQIIFEPSSSDTAFKLWPCL